MNPPTLTNLTGFLSIDTLLRTLASTFELAFPHRVRGYYVIGSYAERTAVPLSDLDCCILFKHDFESQAEHHRARQLSQQCAQSSPIRLDAIPCSEATCGTLHSVLQVALTLGSMLVYGEDVRSTLPLPQQPTYAQTPIQGAFRFIAGLRGQEQLSVSHVEYPDPGDEFYGYTHLHIREWYPPGLNESTKELVATVSRIAAAQVAGDPIVSSADWGSLGAICREAL